MLAAEFLAKVGPLLIVVAYAPTDQDSTEEKDRFCSDLDRVISNGNGLAMVMADFIASVSERMKRVVESHGVGRCTSDNGERHVSFASANGMCISNTFFHTSTSIKHRDLLLAKHPSQALRSMYWSSNNIICPGHKSPQGRRDGQ